VEVPVAPPIVSLLNEKPLAENVRALVLVSDKTIFAVPLNNTKPPDVKSKIVPTPDRVHVPEPIFNVLDELPEVKTIPVVAL